MMSTNGLVLELDDRVSAPINKMIGSINVFVNEVRFAGDVINNSFTTNSIVNMSQEFNTAITSVDNFASSISNAASNQDSFNNAVKKSEGIASKAFSVFKNAIGVDSWSDGVKKIVDMSDKYTQMSTKLSSIAGEGENLADIQNKIFGSANSGRTSYTAMADAVSQFGKEAKSAFGSTDEIIGFADGVNKSLAIGGLGEDERTSAMSYVSDSMSDGSISGDELNEIMSYSPVIGESLSKYMGVPENLVQEYANEGKLSAEAFKNAVLSSGGEINSQFSALPATWGEIWTTLGNFATKALTPILTVVSWLASNFSLLAPIILGVAAAFGVYAVFTNITTVALNALKIAQAAANAVMALNPIGLIIIGIIALIAAIYFIIGLINRGKNEAISATGIIMGALAVVGTFIMNVFIGVFNAIVQALLSIFVYPFLGIIEWILNAANGGFNSFGGAVANLIGQIIGWFLSLGQIVTRIIDAIFGTNWTSGLEELRNSVISWGKNENAINLTEDSFTGIERNEYGDAWVAGNGFGKSIDDKVSSFIGGEEVSEIEPSGFVPAGGNSFDATGGIGDTLNNISNDTSAISNEVATSAENEEYLRKIAERDVIVRYVTPNISVSMNNKNNIQNGMDIDGVIDHLARGTAAAMAGMGEGA